MGWMLLLHICVFHHKRYLTAINAAWRGAEEFLRLMGRLENQWIGTAASAPTP
jgi:hypothetical protein